MAPLRIVTILSNNDVIDSCYFYNIVAMVIKLLIKPSMVRLYLNLELNSPKLITFLYVMYTGGTAVACPPVHSKISSLELKHRIFNLCNCNTTMLNW